MHASSAAARSDVKITEDARGVTFLERKKIRGAVYRREDIACGSRLRVPSIVTEYSATTLIPEGCQARVDAWGNMIIDVAQTGQ